MMAPIADFIVESGLEIREFQLLLREAVVRNISGRQMHASNRINKSGIAAAAGITRAEVSRILASPSNPSRNAGRKHGHDSSTNRILAGWREDPKFTTSDGQPAGLKMYGRGATFESLVRK